MKISLFRTCLTFGFAALLSALAQTPPAASQSEPAAAQPAAPAAAPRPAYKVSGFRSAKFGMTEEEVRAAIKADFSVEGDAVQEGSNEVDRTRSLTVTAPALEPGPGAATVVYIFGAASKELMHVNLVWQMPATASDDERRAVVTAGLQLANYFRGFSWAEGREAANVPLGPNSILLFAATDAAKGGVEVRGEGVRYDFVGEGGAVQKSPAPQGGAALTVAYSRDVENPDVYRIETGKF
jgi:hypothetical protein